MSRFYLIGGHDFDTKNNYIAKRLLDLTHKTNPNNCFSTTSIKW